VEDVGPATTPCGAQHDKVAALGHGMRSLV
jgi:hypothetical protein